MSRSIASGRALRTVAAFLVGGALVAGCDSSDDDGGDTDGAPTDPMGPNGMNGGMNGALDSSASFADIIRRGPNDEPYELGAGLADDLTSSFGDAAGDPVDIEDGQGIDAVASRRASAAR